MSQDRGEERAYLVVKWSFLVVVYVVPFCLAVSCRPNSLVQAASECILTVLTVSCAIIAVLSLLIPRFHAALNAASTPEPFETPIPATMQTVSDLMLLAAGYALNNIIMITAMLITIVIPYFLKK